MPLPRKTKATNIPVIPWEDCIAKSTIDGTPSISVSEHCQIVGEVSKALMEQLSPSTLSLLGNNPPVVVSLHDLGKVSPGFQKKLNPERVELLAPGLAKLPNTGFETLHAKVSEIALGCYLKSRNLKDWAAVVVGAHHGVRSEITQYVEGTEDLGGEGWAQERKELIEYLIQQFGEFSVENVPDLDALSGLICVSDWIGSDEKFFPPQGLPPNSDLPTLARNAVSACGWGSIPIQPGLSFEELFGFSPYPAQQDFMDMIDGPGLYVFEAPMGLGKTEAALYAAYRLLESGDNEGLFFGLPTRLTSDRIHERVVPFVRQITKDNTNVRLAHGLAWLREYEHGGELLGGGKEWFKPSKRALLLRFAVGTIDQALLGAIKVRHHFIRCFGLAGKVVILDEVHSYDLYTGTLLDHLVKRLLELNCTVIILSATLTKSRRNSFFQSPKLLESASAYPLVCAQNTKGTQSKASVPPEDKCVMSSVLSLSAQEVANSAVEKALIGGSVLCVANTVAQAQHWYREVKATMPEKAFDVGLLHSKFPAWRRAELEEHWMQRLGKSGDRSKGCILIATQIVEQSVDLDADLLITELAPTDMLLQRIGRLWRHSRDKRPLPNPVFFIVSNDLDQVSSFEELIEAIGKSNSFVYSPYVLWRSFQVWKTRSKIGVPSDIRDVLEATYSELSEDIPEFIKEAQARQERRKEKLRRVANTIRSDVKGFCTMKDDENAATRYNELPMSDVLLVKQVNSRGDKAILTLSNEKNVSMDRYKWEPSVMSQLHQNLVSIPKHKVPAFQSPQYLEKYFYEETPLLFISSSGELLLDGNPTEFRYDNELGFQQKRTDKTLSTKQTKSKNTISDDIDEWEGGFDEFDW